MRTFKPKLFRMKILAYLHTIALFIQGEKKWPIFIKIKRLGFVPCPPQTLQNKSTSIKSYNRFPSVYLRGKFDLYYVCSIKTHIFIKLSRIQDCWLRSPNFNYSIVERIITKGENWTDPKQLKLIPFSSPMVVWGMWNIQVNKKGLNSAFIYSAIKSGIDTH